MAEKATRIARLIGQWGRCGYTADSTLAFLWAKLAVAWYQQNNLTRAVASLDRSIRLSLMNGLGTNQGALPRSYYNLGVFYDALDNKPAALEAWKRSVYWGNRFKTERKWVAASSIKIAYAYQLTGDYERSIRAAETGIQAAKLTQEYEILSECMHEKGQSLYRLGRLGEAVALMEQPVKLAGMFHNDPAAIGKYEKLLGEIERKQNHFDKALGHYQRALQIYKQHQEQSNQGLICVSIGLLFFEYRQYEKSLEYYRKALVFYPDGPLKGLVLGNMGAVFSSQSNFPAALSHYQQAVAHYLSVQKRSVTASNVRQVADKFNFLELIQDKADTWLDWATATQNNPVRLRNALNTYALADTMIDFMRWEHTGQQSKLFWRSKTHRLYEQAIETAFRLNDAASAFHFMEKSRAVLLNDKLNELGASRQLAPAQVTQERQLRQRVADWQTKVAAEKPNTPVYAKKLDSLRTAQEQQEAFVRNLERTNPTYYRYKYDNQTIPLSRVNGELTRWKASLFTYFIGDSTLYAISITPTGTKLLQLPAAAYTKPAAELLALNANPDALNRQFPHYLTVANQLYRSLLAPANLPPGRVIVSPDGVLLPFDALSTSATKPDFLVNQYAFSYAYSLNQLFKESTDVDGKRDWFRQSGTFLGIAPVAFSTRLGQVPLAGSDAVLSRIGGHFSDPSLFTGASATRRAFGRQVEHYRIIQLFTHADADSSGREPTLFFADSTLHLSELTATGQLPAELVGLLACKTGVGANQRGEGVFSLARGFAALGVPSVLTTLWNVENQATYALTELFYTKLAAGLPKDVALQQAKLDYLADADQSEQLPNRWAGLLLVGNAAPIERSSPLALWGGGLVILGLAGGGWWLLRRRRQSGLTS